MKKLVFGRGLNRHGQLGLDNMQYDVKEQTQIMKYEDERGVEVEKSGDFDPKHIRCSWGQSYIISADDTVWFSGWPLDTRSQNYSALAQRWLPNLTRFFQNFVPVLGARSNIPRFIPYDQFKRNQITILDIQVGGGFTGVLSDEGQLYFLGQNDNQQCMTGKQEQVEEWTQVDFGQRVISQALGQNQSIVILEDGTALGAGSNTNYQQSKGITRNIHDYQKAVALGDSSHWKVYVDIPTKINHYNLNDNFEQVHNWTKVTCGLHHTILANQQNELQAVGQNTFGQCGLLTDELEDFSMNKPSNAVAHLSKVNLSCVEDNNERLIEFASGNRHNLVLTDKSVYGFGSNYYNQLLYGFNQEMISTAVELPWRDQLDEDEWKPVSIDCKFEKSSITFQNDKDDKYDILQFGNDKVRDDGDFGEVIPVPILMSSVKELEPYLIHQLIIGMHNSIVICSE